MNWKEFFRPTTGKVALSFGIAFIPLYKVEICPFRPPCFNYWVLIFPALNSFLGGILGLQAFTGKPVYRHDLLLDIVPFLLIFLTIFVIYLVSCIVVYNYNKIMNKVRK